MNTAVRALMVSVTLVTAGLLPTTAAAQHHATGVRAQHHATSVRAQHHGALRGHDHFQQRPNFHHRSLGSRFFFVSPFDPFTYSVAPIVVYTAPPYYAAPPPVYGAPLAYSAPATYAPAPALGPPPAPAAAPPLQQEIEPASRDVVFPSGRYVLRGDGIGTPYTWVWIPNPPAAPPGGASRSRERERTIYSWTDANGVTTWTDRLASVPAQYRAGARRDLAP